MSIAGTMSATDSRQIAKAAAGLSGAPDLPALLSGIAQAALTALGADRATCYSNDVEAQVVSGVYSTEVDPERRAFLERAKGLGAAQLPIWRLQLAQVDPLLVIEDIGCDPVVPAALAARLGSGALLGVRLEHPSILHGGAPALLGTLFCSFSAPKRISTVERKAALGLASLATLALTNAHLQAETAQSLEATRALAAEQAALRRVATLVATEAAPEALFAQAAKEVAGLLEVECGLVARFEPTRAVPVGWWGSHQPTIDLVFPLDGAGALAQVSRSGRVARVGDYESLSDDPVGKIVRAGGYRSAVAAPVRVGGRLWGALLAATTEDAPIDADAEGRLERFTELVAVAIANAEAQARLVAQAASDPLTGLANHGAFFERLDAELRRSRRHGRPLSLILIDLDHFKSVNDAHGHLAGDGVLVEIARRLGAVTRGEDVLARVGGEEFAWLLPESDARSAWTAGERARRAIAGEPFPGVGQLTISAGVAELGMGTSATELFHAADAALYWAKTHGRNACVPHTPEHELVIGHQRDASNHLAPNIERLVTLAREQLGLPLAVVTEFQDDLLVVRHVDGDAAAFGVHPGIEIPLEETFCVRATDGRLPSLVRDAHHEERVRDLPITRTAGIGAYIGVPITFPDGDLYGTLCCLSPRAEPALGPRDVRLLTFLANMVGEELERDGKTRRIHTHRREGIRRVLEGEGLSIVFQPIVELVEGHVVFAEALSRFSVEPYRTPDIWFADADALGLGVELELAAIRAGLGHLDELPTSARLSLNVSPATLCSPELIEALAATPGARLAIELTEHAPVHDYPTLMGALAALRSRGVQFMIDDAGAGFSSLKHVLDLRPDAIKLDLSLTRDIDSDPVRRALAASLVAFGRETGAIIVAEGIETQAELQILRELGVTHGQGYLLARPGPGPVPERVAFDEAAPAPVAAS